MDLTSKIPLLTCLNIGLTAGSHAMQDDRQDEYLPAKRFNIRIGVLIIDDFETTVRFDSRQFPIGTPIDLEDNFSIDDPDDPEGRFIISRDARVQTR